MQTLTCSRREPTPTVAFAPCFLWGEILPILRFRPLSIPARILGAEGQLAAAAGTRKFAWDENALKNCLNFRGALPGVQFSVSMPFSGHERAGARTASAVLLGRAEVHCMDRENRSRTEKAARARTVRARVLPRIPPSAQLSPPSPGGPMQFASLPAAASSGGRPATSPRGRLSVRPDTPSPAPPQQPAGNGRDEPGRPATG